MKHLVLSFRKFPSINKKLILILNKKIQRLDIDISFGLEQLTEISSTYVVNVKYINYFCNENWKKPQCYANDIIKILNSFKNLKTLTIYILPETILANPQFRKFIQCFHINKINKNYHVKHFRQYYLFQRKLLFTHQ